MANTDEDGNKIAQKKVSKKARSANLREQRKQRVNYCDVCGYKPRSVGHWDGSHHKAAEAKLKK